MRPRSRSRSVAKSPTHERSQIRISLIEILVGHERKELSTNVAKCQSTVVSSTSQSQPRPRRVVRLLLSTRREANQTMQRNRECSAPFHPERSLRVRNLRYQCHHNQISHGPLEHPFLKLAFTRRIADGGLLKLHISARARRREDSRRSSSFASHHAHK